MYRPFRPAAIVRILAVALGLLPLLAACQSAPAPPAAAPASPADVSAATDAGPSAASPPAATPATATPPPTPTVAPLPELRFTPQGNTAIPPGEAFTGNGGVTVQLPPAALADDTAASLQQWDIDPAWRRALEQAYAIDTPFVSLALSGINDGLGRAMLRLPATGPDSRMLAVIDHTYLVLLEVPPTDGYVETAVRLGPSTGGPEQVGSLAPGGSLQYAVVTPRAATAAKPHLGKPAIQVGRNCGVALDPSFGRITHCRRSAGGEVQVSFLSGLAFTDAQADALADATAAAMAGYGELGFTAARLTAGAPMQIVVEGGTGDPRYRSLNGVIYLPVDAALAMVGGTTTDTLHEMAHWIQDEAYNMAWAYWSGGKTWWLETAAETMVMLHQPEYTAQNLATYGAITTDDNRLALQHSPYQWPGDFYAHAQMVRLNMCADAAVCPLSQASFVAAINDGAYPFDSDAARSLVSANLDAYAHYLLGVTPTGGNVAMPLAGPVASGDGYGEYVQVAQTTRSAYSLSSNGVAPQMQPGRDNLGDTVEVAATLQKDGVYPLAVTSGLNGRFPGVPARLTIQPGAPFWYRLGSDPPQFHDGSQELVLQPIHLTMGIPWVRLVALGRAGGETFRATVGQVDLQGAWLMVPGEQVAGNISCPRAEGNVSVSVDQAGLVALPTLVGMLGDFQPDAAGSGLTWAWQPARVPAEVAPYTGATLQFEGAALSGGDEVQVQTRLTWVPTESRAPAPAGWSLLGLGLAAAVPGAWSIRGRRRRPPGSLLGLAVALLLLTGCFGLGLDMWGTISAEMQYTTLEFVGGTAVPTINGEEATGLAADLPPLWRLQGTADYTVDFYVVATDSDEDNGETATVHCTGTATYKMEARIYTDINVALE